MIHPIMRSVPYSPLTFSQLLHESHGIRFEKLERKYKTGHLKSFISKDCSMEVRASTQSDKGKSRQGQTCLLSLRRNITLARLTPISSARGKICFRKGIHWTTRGASINHYFVTYLRQREPERKIFTIVWGTCAHSTYTRNLA